MIFAGWIAMAGLTLWAFLSSKSKKTAGALKGGYMTPPQERYSLRDIDNLTEYRSLPDGKIARYFKAQFQQSLRELLAKNTCVLGSQINMPEGPIFYYTLSRTATGHGAGTVAEAAVQKGHAVLISLSVALKPDMVGSMILCPANYRADYASPKYDLAVLIDSVSVPVQPTGGTVPTPPKEPGWTTPPLPDGGTGKKKRHWDLDENMSEVEKDAAEALLDNQTIPASGYDIAATAADYKGYPKFAALCRMRAAQVRSKAEPGTKQPKAPPPPHVTVKKTPETTTPETQPPPVYPIMPPPPEPAKKEPASFVIREGHIPYAVAKWYTGDPNRWKEFVPANSFQNMKVVTKNGVTQLDPWYGGLQVAVPADWPVKDTDPPTLSGGAPSPKSPWPDDRWKQGTVETQKAQAGKAVKVTKS